MQGHGKLLPELYDLVSEFVVELCEAAQEIEEGNLDSFKCLKSLAALDITRLPIYVKLLDNLRDQFQVRS